MGFADSLDFRQRLLVLVVWSETCKFCVVIVNCVPASCDELETVAISIMRPNRIDKHSEKRFSMLVVHSTGTICSFYKHMLMWNAQHPVTVNEQTSITAQFVVPRIPRQIPFSIHSHA